VIRSDDIGSASVRPTPSGASANVAVSGCVSTSFVLRGEDVRAAVPGDTRTITPVTAGSDTPHRSNDDPYGTRTSIKKDVPSARGTRRTLTVPAAVPRSGWTRYEAPGTTVRTSLDASQPISPTCSPSLWNVEPPPMTVNGSPYSEYVQLDETATRTPPLVHDRLLAWLIPKLCDSSCAITRSPRAPLLYV